MKIATEHFEKYSRHELAVWKNCRNKDINKFESTNVREDLSSKINTLTYDLNKTVTEFEKKIDKIVLSTKEINEMLMMKWLNKSLHVGLEQSFSDSKEA